MYLSISEASGSLLSIAIRVVLLCSRQTRQSTSQFRLQCLTVAAMFYEFLSRCASEFVWDLETCVVKGNTSANEANSLALRRQLTQKCNGKDKKNGPNRICRSKKLYSNAQLGGSKD